jgi:hypothetical protein
MYNQEVWLRRRQRSATFYFRYAPPVFGPDGEDLTGESDVKPPFHKAPAWKCSVYYYWWEFLRMEESYLQDARAGNDDSPVLRDFGDPDAYGGFHGWWLRVGRYLFSEPRERSIRWSDNPDDLPKSTGCVYISVPFRCDVEQALTELRDILRPEMDVKKAEIGPSGARYPVFTKPILSALHKRLEALKLSRLGNLTHSEIGKQLTIGPQGDDADSKNGRTTSVSRCLREARFLVDFAVGGFFPVIDPEVFRAAREKGLLREPGTRVNA